VGRKTTQRLDFLILQMLVRGPPSYRPSEMQSTGRYRFAPWIFSVAVPSWRMARAAQRGSTKKCFPHMRPQLRQR